jgi:hypothetical protein
MVSSKMKANTTARRFLTEKATDERFAMDERLDDDDETHRAGPSKRRRIPFTSDQADDEDAVIDDEELHSDTEEREGGQENEDEFDLQAATIEDGPDENTEDDDPHGLPAGMDPVGFSASSNVVKPLTPAALAEFQAAQDRAGVVYISRIPPGMRPPKVRHLMSLHGEVGRVYLQQEGAHPLSSIYRASP